MVSSTFLYIREVSVPRNKTRDYWRSSKFVGLGTIREVHELVYKQFNCNLLIFSWEWWDTYDLKSPVYKSSDNVSRSTLCDHQTRSHHRRITFLHLVRFTSNIYKYYYLTYSSVLHLLPFLSSYSKSKGSTIWLTGQHVTLPILLSFLYSPPSCQVWLTI